jgi:putative CocE/NonD family hydrolase
LRWPNPARAAGILATVRTVTDLPHRVREIENTWVPVPGTHDRMAARMFMPEGASVHHQVPAILEYLPYRKREFTATRDTSMHRYLAGNGFASVRIDMRGSGDSDGIMTDEYLPQELNEGAAAIAWLAEQSWCNGNVGMIGNSWGGFNGLQIAALRPPTLKAIVTSCSTDDRYTDDMHYMGGSLLTDTLDWGATFYTLLGRPPDPPLVGDRWRDMWMARMEQLNFMVEDWLRHQRRDAFWKHGSVNEDYSAIQCPVFAVGGYLDGYSNAIFRLLANLKVPRMGLVGPWAHAFPHLGVPDPQVNFLAEVVRWFDRWLKGEENGVEREPMLRTFMPDGLPASAFYSKIDGRWVAEETWPSPRIRLTAWRLESDGGLDEDGSRADGGDAAVSWSSPQLTGLVGGEWCPYGTGGKGPEFPGDQREDDGRSLTFTSEPLAERTEILGAPVVELELAVDRPEAFVAVRLCDVGPDGASTRVTYGVLNLSHRASHEDIRPMIPGQRERVRVQLNDAAYAFKPGHRVRVGISTTYWPMVWPSPETVTLTLWPAESRLTLPVRPPRAEDAQLTVDTDPESGEPADLSPVRPGRWERTIHTDVLTGETTVTNVADPGLVRLNNLDLTFGMAGEDVVGIREGDPLSCWAEGRRVSEQRRGDWSIRLEGRIRLTSTATDFNLVGDFEGFENDQSVFRQHKEAVIPRDHG